MASRDKWSDRREPRQSMSSEIAMVIALGAGLIAWSILDRPTPAPAAASAGEAEVLSSTSPGVRQPGQPWLAHLDQFGVLPDRDRAALQTGEADDNDNQERTAAALSEAPSARHCWIGRMPRSGA